MVNPATLAAELAMLEGSNRPAWKAIASLYHQGKLRPAGVRDGRVTWQAVEQGGSANG